MELWKGDHIHRRKICWIDDTHNPIDLSEIDYNSQKRQKRTVDASPKGLICNVEESLLFYQKLCKDLEGHGFQTPPYDHVLQTK